MSPSHLESVREVNLLERIVDFCCEQCLEFYAIDANNPNELVKEAMLTPCWKSKADLFIDDQNVSCLPDGWGIEMVRNRWNCSH